MRERKTTEAEVGFSAIKDDVVDVWGGGLNWQLKRKPLE